MSEYVDFHYLPLEGKITGKQVLKQTEDAINDLGNKVYNLDIDQSKIDEAIEKSNEAINTANSALAAVTTGRSVWFNNVAEMVATDIEAGVTAETKGYYVANDGGNALYLVRQEKSGDVVDGGSLIALDNGNMAELVTDGTVNVKQFGAIGNGTDDDTTALQNASTYAQTNGFVPFVGVATYKITGNVTGTFNSFGEVTITGGGTVDIINLHEVVSDVSDIRDEVADETASAKAYSESAATYATNASNSASSASATATQLMAYLETKEEISAPVVDHTLTMSGAAADAKVTGDKIQTIDNAIMTDITIPACGTTDIDSLVNFNTTTNGCYILTDQVSSDTTITSIKALVTKVTGATYKFKLVEYIQTENKAIYTVTKVSDEFTFSAPSKSKEFLTIDLLTPFEISAGHGLGLVSKELGLFRSRSSAVTEGGTHIIGRGSNVSYDNLAVGTKLMNSSSAPSIAYNKVNFTIYADVIITKDLTTEDEVADMISDADPKGSNHQYFNLLELLDGITSADTVHAMISSSDGTISTSTNNNVTTLKKFIPVEAGKTYGIAKKYTPALLSGQSWSNVWVSWYDADKFFISRNNGTTNLGFTAPTGASFCRLTTESLSYSALWGTDDFSDFYMEECNNGIQVRTINAENITQNAYPLTTMFGKEWMLFGDSITALGIRSTANYHDYIRSELGINTTNYAVGGAGYKCSDDLNSAVYQKVYQARDIISGYDVITIMAGVNDCTYFGTPQQMGDIDDVFVGDDYTIATNNTVFACVNKAIDLIYEYAPLAKLGVILPLPAVTTRGQDTYTFNPSDPTNRMSIFVENMKTLLSKRGIPYLDLYHNSALRPWDDAVNNAFFKCNSEGSPDRLHPNHLGHKFFYPLVREFMKKLL